MRRAPSIPFCLLRLSIRCRLSGAHCMVCAALSAGVFVKPSSSLGPTNVDDGESAHQVEFWERTPAWRCSAPVFQKKKRISCALVTMLMSISLRGGNESAWNSRSVSLMSTTCASILPSRCRHRHGGFSSLLGLVEIHASERRDVYGTPNICALRGFCHLSVPGATADASLIVLRGWCGLSLCRDRRNCQHQCYVPVPCVQDVVPSSLPSARMSPMAFPSFPSLRIACSENSLRRSAESRACASSLLVVRCRLKKTTGQVPECSQPRALSVRIRVSDPLPMLRNFGFAVSNDLSNACRNSNRLSPFCKRSAIACTVPFVVPRLCCRCECLSSLRLQCVAQWSRTSPAGMICNLRLFSRPRDDLQPCDDIQQIPPCDPACVTCPVVRNRKARFRVQCCDRGAVCVSEQAFHFVSCQLLFAPLVLCHKGFFDLFTRSL